MRLMLKISQAGRFDLRLSPAVSLQFTVEIAKNCKKFTKTPFLGVQFA